MKTREEVADILREIKNLPTLPTVASKVLEMTEDMECSQQELASVVERDPTIATRLLKLVNSPFYGIRGAVSSVQQALIYVGISNIRNLVLSASAMELFSDKGFVGPYSRQDLWIHSLATAIAARRIAIASRAVDPEIAFTAGLIHDVGKVVIDRYFHDEFVRIIELIQRHRVSMADVETSVLGLDHAEIGEYLAKRWSLPDMLQEAIGFHHDSESAPNHKHISALILLADTMARDLRVGVCLGETAEIPGEVWQRTNMDPDVFEQIKESLSEDIEESIRQMTSI